MRKRIGIVGGGMLGLSLAYRLAQRDCAVTVFESSALLGGLASSWQLGDLLWDKHYHVILASDRALRSLLSELRLEEEITWVATQTGFFIDNRLHPFTSPTDFARLPAFNAFEKLRLLATIFITSRHRDAALLENTSVSHYLRRLSGPRVFNLFWLPLLRAKLGESYQEASASFIWATIRRLTAARRAGIQERFGYVTGGYRSILAALSKKLSKYNVEVRVSSPVSEVTSSPAGLQIFIDGKAAETFQQVVVTTPAPVAVRQCKQLTESEKASWSSIRYQGIVCASLLTKNALGPYYLTNICDSQIPFTAVVEMSALMRREEFGGRSLIYLPKYVAPDDPLFGLSDEQIRESFLAGVSQMYPAFRESEVEAFQISRVRQVFAVPTLNYSAKLPSMQTSVPGLSIVNSAHIVNGTLNVNEVVQLATQASERLSAAC